MTEQTISNKVFMIFVLNALYLYSAINYYLANNELLCRFFMFVRTIWNACKQFMYNIRTYPTTERWASVSYLIRTRQYLYFEDTYRELGNGEEGTYPLYLSPYPVITEVLLVYKQDEHHYRITVINSYWEFLKSCPSIKWMNMEESGIEILSIEYSNPDEKIEGLEIEVPLHDQMVGNVILSTVYIMRYLTYRYGIYYSINTNYSIHAVLMKDTDIESVTLDSSQALLLKKDAWEIVS